MISGGSGSGTTGYALGSSSGADTGHRAPVSDVGSESSSDGSSDESTDSNGASESTGAPEPPQVSCEEECLAAGWFCTEAVDACSGAVVACDALPDPGCVHHCTCEN